MIKIEQNSGYSSEQLMLKAGYAVYEKMQKLIPEKASVLILAGKGNNGGDGFVLARLMEQNYNVRVYLPDGMPASAEARNAFTRMPEHLLARQFDLTDIDYIVDAVYGFSYHGKLRDHIRPLFQQLNQSGIPVFSIDINSGAEADSGWCDPDALHSSCTLALECYKPVHMMNKTLALADTIECLSMQLPHFNASNYSEMDEDRFFELFPKKSTLSYKGSNGRILLIAGSKGMAGAALLNILGARTLGAGYIECALPEAIYPIAAAVQITTVYHPFTQEDAYGTIEHCISGVKAIGFGSGAVYMPEKQRILQLLLKQASAPVVLDAEALRMLAGQKISSEMPLILTPHIGEFKALAGLNTVDRPLEQAAAFAKQNHVILVLKGPNTIVASYDGRIYINQSGNQSLAQAGSGDVLTGIITAILSFIPDPYTAACAAVYIHGAIADRGHVSHSYQNFRLEEFPAIMDEIFKAHES